MKRIGNAESNKTYNPRNAKPQMPIDIDEVDSAMERYIRQKYEQRVYMHESRPGTRQNTGSTSSDDRPPPLPPKPTGRFGFGLRKAATSPRSITPPVSPGTGSFRQEASPPRVNKPSRVFGSTIQTSGDGLDSKLATLRDMGFPDDRRNSTVLKGLNGNLDRTVEALIRLGEQNQTTKSRGTTPTLPTKPSANGLSFDRTQTAPAATVSTNPFDALDAIAAAPQQYQPAALQTRQAPYGGGPSAPTAPPSNSSNPYLSQAHYQQQSTMQPPQHNNFYSQPAFGHPSLEHSFQNMQIATQQEPQPLFPNRTGGYGPTQPPLAQTNPFTQSFTPPPMPQIPEQYSSFFAPQPQYQSMSSPSSPGNPFLRSSKSQVFPQANSNPFGQQTAQQQLPPQQQQPSNPFMAQQQQPAPTGQVQNPWQKSQLSSQQTGYQQQMSTPTTQAPNPWHTMPQNYQQLGFQQQQNTPQSSYQHQPPQQSQQPPGFQPGSGTFDKNSIMSLYNYPQMAPPRSEQPQPTSALASAPIAPASGHMNPFSGAQQGQPLSATQTHGVRHVSNESVDFSMDGRHSPDAFSGLSASFRR
jgi:hypothetical protein